MFFSLWTVIIYSSALNGSSEYKKDQLSNQLISQIAWRRPTLTGGNPQLPSALKSLTSVFGMGTGVTSSLSHQTIKGILFLQN